MNYFNKIWSSFVLKLQKMFMFFLNLEFILLFFNVSNYIQTGISFSFINEPILSTSFSILLFHLTICSVVHSTEEDRHIPLSSVAVTKRSIRYISNQFPSDGHLHHFQAFALIIIAAINSLTNALFFVFARVSFF